jgi:hypothetical protein
MIQLTLTSDGTMVHVRPEAVIAVFEAPASEYGNKGTRSVVLLVGLEDRLHVAEPPAEILVAVHNDEEYRRRR